LEEIVAEKTKNSEIDEQEQQNKDAEGDEAFSKGNLVLS